MKKITMKNCVMSSWNRVIASTLGCAAISLPLTLIACGDNVTDNDPIATQAYADQDSFPECNEAYEGMFATIASSQELYICTAGEWMNLSKAGSQSAGKSGCSAKDLEDASGVEITCNGKVVGTLNYGKAGAKGSDGDKGDKGSTGGKGSDGSSFSGTTPKWDTGRCKLKNAGLDYMIYECGDSTYVRGLVKANKYNSYVWNPMKEFGVLYNSGTLKSVSYIPTGASGSLMRGEDSWSSGTALSSDDFTKYMTIGIEATAKVEVPADQEVSADDFRPFVGVGVDFASDKDMGSRVGLCVTYSSPKEMGLLLKGETGYLRAILPAASTDTVVNVRWFEFSPVAESVDPDRVIRRVSSVYVEAAGGEKKGEYENTFTLSQLGDYGKCNDSTFNNWVAQVEKLKEKGEDLVVGSLTYPTIKIGDQTWMAADLQTPYNYTSKGGEFMSDCLTEPEFLAKKGCSYTWAAAMDSASQLHGYASTNSAYNDCGYNKSCSATEPVQGICPDGWHLPSISEWGKLFATLLQGKDGGNDFWARLLFIGDDSEDYYVKNSNSGKNLSGMNFFWDNNDVRHWSSTQYDATVNTYAFDFYSGHIHNYNAVLYVGEYRSRSRTNEYKVRCVKDATPAVDP